MPEQNEDTKTGSPNLGVGVTGKAAGKSRDLPRSNLGNQTLNPPRCQCGAFLGSKPIAKGVGIAVEYYRVCRHCDQEYPWARC